MTVRRVLTVGRFKNSPERSDHSGTLLSRLIFICHCSILRKERIQSLERIYRWLQFQSNRTRAREYWV